MMDDAVFRIRRHYLRIRSPPRSRIHLMEPAVDKSHTAGEGHGVI